MTAKKICPSIKSEAFLVGLLSMLPAILDKSMLEILEKLPVNDSIRAALIPKDKGDSQTDLYIILEATKLIEGGSWHLTSKECLKLRLNYDEFCRIYNSAMDWKEKYQSMG